MKPTTIDEYLSFGCGRCPLGNTPDCKVHQWSEELILLRSIILDSELNEELKWSIPCYTYNGKNVLTLSAIKNECVLGFFKGSLLQDTYGLLEQQGPNSHESRVIRFSNVKQIQEASTSILYYISQAIAVEKSGQKVVTRPVSDYDFPGELTQILKENPELFKAFYALTPGKQKGYLLHFSAPKQSATRVSRIEKCTDKILKGKGFHDQ